jgi:hypothetical protein
VLGEQPDRGAMRLDSLIAALAFSAGLLVYLNSLPAGFVFDDNFAVVGQ